MNRAQSLELVNALAQAYPRDAWSPERVELWASLVLDLDYERGKAAVLRWILAEKWPPTIAEIRELAISGERNLADAGWQEVCSEIRRVGSWGAPAWSDPLVAEAVEMVGGWIALCMSENPGMDRARFIAAYERLAIRSAREATVPDEVKELLAGNIAKALPPF